MNILRYDELDSTNNFLKLNAQSLPHATVVVAHNQSAGRGQRGNSWEAEPGKNLTLSILLRPEALRPERQFLISQAVSLAIVDTIAAFIPEAADHLAIKWPNDIYYRDSKICGILIENVISPTHILYSIAGIGLNVNQTRFLSDAPNPISMAQIAATDLPLDLIFNSLIDAILARFDSIADSEDALRSEYFSHLWRADGYYTFIDADSSLPFRASIESVDPSGTINLRCPDGSLKSFAFKQLIQPINQ